MVRKLLTHIVLAVTINWFSGDAFAHVYEPETHEVCYEDGSDSEERMCPG